MKVLSIQSKQSGFTLIEVGIALAIGLVIILGVTSAIQSSQHKASLHSAITQIQTILAASTDYVIQKGSYADISRTKLESLGYVVSSNYTIAVKTGDTGKFTITTPAYGTAIETELSAKLTGQFTITGEDGKAQTLTYPK